jgi:hypothetical protein
MLYVEVAMPLDKDARASGVLPAAGAGGSAASGTRRAGRVR